MEMYCPICQKMVDAKQIDWARFKCPKCSKDLTSSRRSVENIILGTFGMHRHG